MNDIVIVGAGGHAREIAQLIEDINKDNKKWNILGFIDKDASTFGSKNGKYDIIGDESIIHKYKDIHVIIAIGFPTIVQSIVQRLMLDSKNIKFPNLIHPSVNHFMEEVTLGYGNIICLGNIFTTNITMGSFNCINRGCNISHDTIIYDYCIINPGVNISGGVRVNSSCIIGTGATILQYLTINQMATVGAGAVVTKDIGERVRVIGVPAIPME